MATIFAPPVEVGDPPDFDDPRFRDASGRYDFKAHLAAEQEWVDTIANIARSLRPGMIIGEVVRYPMGDGYACYLVWDTNPCQLVWLPIGDEWRLPEAHERGLRTKDIRETYRQQKALENLFRRNP